MQSKIIELRRALRNLIDATASASTKRAVEAREAASAAYRNSLDEQDRERVVRQAQHQIESAPEGSFLKSVDPIVNYDDALRAFGNCLIYETLGAEA